MASVHQLLYPLCEMLLVVKKKSNVKHDQDGTDKNEVFDDHKKHGKLFH